MDTVTAILLTQIPIAIAILIGAYEFYKMRKALVEILDTLAKKSKKQKK